LILVGSMFIRLLITLPFSILTITMIGRTGMTIKLCWIKLKNKLSRKSD